MPFCQNCGNKIRSADARFCPKCGVKQRKEDATTVKADMSMCHNCKNKLHENVKFCGHCGTEVKRQTIRTEHLNQTVVQGHGTNSTITAQESESAYCNGCGMEISTKAKFCPKCGVKQRKGDTTTAKEETPKLSSIKKTSAFGWKAAAVVCAVVVLLLLVVKMQQGGYDGGTVTNYGGLQGGAIQGQGGQNRGALTQTRGGGATAQPESRDRDTPVFSTSTKSGCAYDNPPCSSDYYCENNACIKKQGCQYNNPSCQSNQDCINNQCVLKSGCQYNNPSCPSGYDCINNQCIEQIVCGNGKCQQGESSNNCCIDCGCSTGEMCVNNACIVKEPKLALTNSQPVMHSITIYLSRPSENVGTISITNTGNDVANSVRVILTSSESYFDPKTVDFGSVGEQQSSTRDYALAFTQKALGLSGDLNPISVKATASYYNSVNQKKSSDSTFFISVKGKNYGTDSYYSPWVTPNQNKVREFATKATNGLATYKDDNIRRLAAKWIFESIRAYGVGYVNERVSVGDYNQFPIETLQRKAGDCEDQALLFASLMESIGVPTAIIITPRHAFAGYYSVDGKTITPVETTADTFENAIGAGRVEYVENQQAGKLVLHPFSSEGSIYPQVVQENEPSIPLPDIKKQLIKDCEVNFNLEKGFFVISTVQFQNNGDAPGAGCVMATVSQNDIVKDVQYPCWTVLAHQTIQQDIALDTVFGLSATCDVQ